MKLPQSSLCEWADESAAQYQCKSCGRHAPALKGLKRACTARTKVNPALASQTIIVGAAAPKPVFLGPTTLKSKAPGNPAARAVSAGGPGTELHALLGRIGIRAAPNCSCRRHTIEMDANGCAWCRDNLGTIVGWLREEAGKRKLPFSATAAGALVRLAIRRAEKKQGATIGTPAPPPPTR